MSRIAYAIGDQVVLIGKPGRTAAAERTCRIVGILPSDHNEPQYRVRFEGENFERRIVATDIDTSETPSPAAAALVAVPTQRAEPWFKPSRIKIGK
jgi:hypothetical protein